MTDEEMREIRARADAATRGPWLWSQNPACKSVELCQGHGGMGDIVMAFERYGMQRAAPSFPIDGLLYRCDDERIAAVIPGREHHASWARQVEHPNAEFIAHARTDVPALCDALDEALRERWAALVELGKMRKRVAELEGGCIGNMRFKPQETVPSHCVHCGAARFTHEGFGND